MSKAKKAGKLWRLLPAMPEPGAVLELYQQKGLALQRWRWRLIAKNGRVVADSGEAYTTKRGVLRAVERLRVLAPNAQLTERE